MLFRKALIVLVWFPLACISLVSCLYSLKLYSKPKDSASLLKIQARQMIPKNGYQFFASLPQVLGSFNSAVSTGDARPEILKQFLDKHKSPITPFAHIIITQSDKYNLDFRLITAIAMCESNLGKKMPENSYNAWGYAIYTGEKSGAEFENWEQGIEVMADYLKTKYYDNGLTSPDQIGPIYAPPSVETGNSWAKCVQGFMDELI